ncbi:hypothetical protein Xszus_04258 [Xenorhabdus szentirmaii]|nr:hypothetical protein Xsze_04392 [Xenorhabdus szentirmaii DSM 16338]PHM44424.1 hypothetical protein Xszus_04258 [Xenorhabdus szentirmaii]
MRNIYETHHKVDNKIMPFYFNIIGKNHRL